MFVHNGQCMHRRRWAAAMATLFAVQPASAQPRAEEEAPQIRVEQDIPYAGTDQWRQALDLFLPAEPSSAKPLPVIVYIHGGAWRHGSRHAGWNFLRPWVRSGDYAGVSIGYRLSDQAQWPAQIHDCKAAIRWIRGNAERYHLNPDRIAVVGHSAGGHLAALLGVSGDVEALEGELGEWTSASSRVQCVIDFCGPSDFLTIGDSPSAIDHQAADAPATLLLGGPISEREKAAREASPVTHASADDPPHLLVHGDRDDVVPYSQATTFHRALRVAQVPTALVTVQGGGHGGLEGAEVLRLVATFLERHLRLGDVDVADTTVSAPGS
jgi:acetyl esterase/lipase